jgi:hypothetical protein
MRIRQFLLWQMLIMLVQPGFSMAEENAAPPIISHALRDSSQTQAVGILHNGEHASDFWVKRLVLANAGYIAGLTPHEQTTAESAASTLASFMEKEVQRLKQQVCDTLLSSEVDNATLAYELAGYYTDSDEAVATRIEQEYHGFFLVLSADGRTSIERFVAEELQAYFAAGHTDWFESSANDPAGFIHGAYQNCTFR